MVPIFLPIFLVLLLSNCSRWHLGSHQTFFCLRRCFWKTFVFFILLVTERSVIRALTSQVADKEFLIWSVFDRKEKTRFFWHNSALAWAGPRMRTYKSDWHNFRLVWNSPSGFIDICLFKERQERSPPHYMEISPSWLICSLQYSVLIRVVR